MAITDLAHYAELLDQRVDDMVDELVARYAREFPAWGASARPELVEPARQLAKDSIHAEIAALREGRLPRELAGADAEFARASARIGIPINNLIWGFRAGHQAQWRRWLELVEAGEQDPVRRHALLERGSAFFFDYADRMIRMVTDQHARERERLLRTREQRRFHLVTELLGGTELDSSTLDYELASWHIGLVLWGPRAAEVAQALGRVHGRDALLVSAVPNTYWAWVRRRDAPGPDTLAALVASLPRGNVRVAIGDAHPGRAGFRETHRQARDAHRVALANDRSVTYYRDVALVVLAARDEQAARAFLASELRGLGGGDTKSRRLSQTLETYLSRGMNAAATAHALGIHEQTVTNRLRTIEQRTGRPVAERHAELAIALRLSRLLDRGA